MFDILRHFRFTVLCAALFLPLSGWAIELTDAKTAGLVGEKPDGYLGTVKDTADARAVADDINARRKAAYEDIARKTGQPLNIVEKLAGEKALNKTEPGNYIKYPDGTWHKK